MKNLLTLIFIISSFCLGAQTHPVQEDLRNRVPELPNTYPIEIVHDPVRIWEPAPPAPPTIPSPESPELHHDSLRNVYWVHGFGGNRDRWSAARDASQNKAQNKQGFKARRLDGHAPQYVENGSLDLAAREVSKEILEGAFHQTEETYPSNFIIGHSQGGVVGRYLVSKDQCSDDPTLSRDYYGGLVTFSSSLNGAQILNSRDAGIINEVSDHICQVIGTLATAGVTGNIVKFAFKNEDGSGGDGQDLCGTFSADVVPFLFKGLNQPISNDYVVGSPILDEVNSCSAPDIAKVAFYGIEPYTAVEGAQFYNPIFYRTVQHFFTDVNWSETWGANDDAALAIKMSKAAEDRYEKYRKAKSQSQFIKFIGFLSFGGQWLSSEIREKAEAHLGVFYLYHDMGDFWMNIIGANAQESTATVITNHSCTCFINQGPSISTLNVPNVTSEAQCTAPNAVYCSYSSYPVTSYVTQWVEKPSDGVVLQESAQYMAGATWPSERLTVRYFDTGVEGEMDTGSSHMQARNDRNTRDALRALYDGKMGLFFGTPVK